MISNYVAWLLSVSFTGHHALIIGTATLLSTLDIAKMDHTFSFVAHIVLTGSLLHYQDMLMLSFILAH